MKSKMLISTVTILKNIYFKKISGAFVGYFWLGGLNFWWCIGLLKEMLCSGNKKYEPLKNETSKIYSTWESRDFGNGFSVLPLMEVPD